MHPLLVAFLAFMFLTPLLQMLEQSGGNAMGHILFLAMLFWVGWQLIKRNSRNLEDDTPQEEEPQQQAKPQAQRQRTDEEEEPLFKSPFKGVFDDPQEGPAERQQDDVESRLREASQMQIDKLKGQKSAIWHVTPEFVTATGNRLGRFRDQPIPEWISTSDGKKGVFTGITDIKLPKECACLELTDRGELIIPPGLVYTVNG
uniref:Uncharacterized protein n=1 Tax=Magnetococcus massalia (strain MO-1) TaxID=451514 RepID=A0A1S7LFA8_MAGMO|nr:conserved protein of unknown function [Candidatus Magnetococcus massalia]